MTSISGKAGCNSLAARQLRLMLMGFPGMCFTHAMIKFRQWNHQSNSVGMPNSCRKHCQQKRNSLSLHHFLISTFDVLRSDICYQDFAPKTSESASPWAQDRHSLDIFGSNLTISCRYERIKTPTAVIIVMAVPGFGLMDSTATSIGRPSWITDQHQSGSAFWGFLKWWYPQIIYFNRVFHYKPSILGYHYFRKHPFWHCSSTMIVNDGKP